MIIAYGPDSILAVSGKGYARLVVENDCVHSLEGKGDPSLVRAVCKRAEALAKGNRMICVLEDDNPMKEKLLKMYQRFGFDRIGITMERRLT